MSLIFFAIVVSPLWLVNAIVLVAAKRRSTGDEKFRRAVQSSVLSNDG